MTVMASGPLLLALDQGTTSTRAILFDIAGKPLRMAQRELRQIYPATGWVEHDPEEIWEASVQVLREAAGDTLPAAIGITNQRETVLLWDRASGACLHNAIVWQDRRTAPVCDRLRAEGREPFVAARSGLLIDPYFSATKLAWLLDALPGARERSDLAFGTVDSFLVWRLTGGTLHATCATNAARTNLFDIHTCAWSPELLALFDVPESLLPEVRGNAGGFGTTDLLGAPVPVAGMAGDQQAATLGQGCLVAGDVKSTFGTGCFLLAHTGAEPVASRHRLLTTVALRLGAGPLRARRRRVRCRRCGAMAARRAGCDSPRRRRPRRWRKARARAAWSWCRPSSAWARPGGTLMRAARSSGSPATRARPISPAPRWRPRRTRPPTCWMRRPPTASSPR